MKSRKDLFRTMWGLVPDSVMKYWSKRRKSGRKTDFFTRKTKLRSENVPNDQIAARYNIFRNSIRKNLK